MLENFSFTPHIEQKPTAPEIINLDQKIQEMEKRIEEEIEYGGVISNYIKEQLFIIVKSELSIDQEQTEKLEAIIDRIVDDSGQGSDGGVGILDEIVADYIYFHPEDQSDDRTQNTFYSDGFKEVLPKCIEEVKKELHI